MNDADIKKLANIVYAEAAGGNLEEIKAVASAFMNTVRNKGAESAFKRSSAYVKNSDQYKKANSGNLSQYEKNVYNNIFNTVSSLNQNPDQVLPYTHFENVNAFGIPSWAEKAKESKDIGRQRFYIIDEGNKSITPRETPKNGNDGLSERGRLFKAARAAGKKEFEYNGKKYTTEVKK